MPKKTLALAAITAAFLVGLTACSPAAEPEPPAPVKTESAPTDEAVDVADDVDVTDDAGAGTEMLSVKDSCELFNSTWADYGDVDPADTEGSGYMDIALAMEQVIPTIPAETYGMFTVLRLAAYETEFDGAMTEETQGLMTQWVLDASGACSEAGVTLQL